MARWCLVRRQVIFAGVSSIAYDIDVDVNCGTVLISYDVLNVISFSRYFSVAPFFGAVRQQHEKIYTTNDEEFLDDRIADIRIQSQFSIIVFLPVSTQNENSTIAFRRQSTTIVMILSELVALLVIEFVLTCNVSYSVIGATATSADCLFFHLAHRKLASLRLLIQLSVHISCVMFLAPGIIARMHSNIRPTNNERNKNVACTHRI